jgi:hypothetical protein
MAPGRPSRIGDLVPAISQRRRPGSVYPRHSVGSGPGRGQQSVTCRPRGVWGSIPPPARSTAAGAIDEAPGLRDQLIGLNPRARTCLRYVPTCHHAGPRCGRARTTRYRDARRRLRESPDRLGLREDRAPRVRCLSARRTADNSSRSARPLRARIPLGPSVQPWVTTDQKVGGSTPSRRAGDSLTARSDAR